MSDLRLLIVLLVSTTLTGCAAAVVGTGIAAGAAVAHDRRTAGTVVEDKEILFKALRLLNDNPDIKEQSNITVTPYNLQVLLTGQAISDQVSQRYAKLVAQIPRVRKVFNEVVPGAESTWTEEADDVYMNSKVKLALFNLGIEGFDPTRVEVTSSQGDVFLMGLLTPQEADAVVEKVRFLSGVKRVVKLFEYLEPAT
jgi:osmotically-inducible protein OsmY